MCLYVERKPHKNWKKKRVYEVHSMLHRSARKKAPIIHTPPQQTPSSKPSPWRLPTNSQYILYSFVFYVFKTKPVALGFPPGQAPSHGDNYFGFTIHQHTLCYKMQSYVLKCSPKPRLLPITQRIHERIHHHHLHTHTRTHAPRTHARTHTQVLEKI